MRPYKVLFALPFIVLSYSTHAQMRPGIAAGMNLSTIAASGEDPNPSTSNILGYHFRGLAEFVLTDNISVESGIGLSTKGFKGNSSFSFSFFGISSTTDVEQSLRINYLDVPLTFKYGIQMDESRVYGGLGPQFGFGMKGKTTITTTTTTNGSTTTSEDSGEINWKEDDIQRVDLGAKALIGFEKNGVFAEAFYEYGLLDIDKTPNSNSVWQNRCLGLTLGFKLGGY